MIQVSLVIRGVYVSANNKTTDNKGVLYQYFYMFFKTMQIKNPQIVKGKAVDTKF